MSDFDFFRVYKTLHVIFVTMLAAGIGIEMVAGPLVARLKTVEELRPVARMMVIAETYMILPAAIFIAGFGYAAAGRANIDLDTTWLLLAQILLLIAFLVGIFVLRPAAVRLQKAVDAAPNGPIPAEIMSELKNPIPAITGASLTLIFVFITYLMVAKPAW
jgi:uncharacterized membrane protein